MNRKLALICLLALTLIFAGCSSKKSSDTKEESKIEKVNVGVIVGNSTSPQPFVMMDQNILADKLGSDIKVNLAYSRDVNYAIENLKKEDFDFFYLYMGAFAEYTSKLSPYGQGDNYVIIAGSIPAGGTNALMAQPGITGIKQLDGKTIGIFNTDPSSEVLVANTLKEYGLDATTRGGTVKILKMPSQKVLDDFVAGKIDSLLVRRDYIEGLGQRGKTTLLKGNEMAYRGKQPTMLLFVKKSFLESNPQLVEKFLEAHVEAGEYFKTHRKEVADKYYPIKEQFFKDRKIVHLSQPIENLYKNFDKLQIDPYPYQQYINDVYDYMEKYNEKKPYPKDELVDFKPLDNVLKSKGMISVEEYNNKNFK